VGSRAWARITWSRPLFGVLVLNLVWTASLFLAPSTIAPGSFYGQDAGGANVLDYGETWASFPTYAQIVYAFGDIQCHQMFTRSFALNGNQLPIDARMTSMYVFANLGVLAAMFAAPSTSTGAVILGALPARLRGLVGRLGPERAGASVVLLGLLPIAVDGFTQLLTPYESTNLVRVITGAPGGFVGGLLVGAMLISIRQIGIEIQAMRARAAMGSARVR
jgi:uncharacterized membrane protein